MNKKAQGKEIAQIFSAIFGIIIMFTFIQAIPSIFNQNCPTCDCSQYQSQLSSCEQNLTSRPVIYVNQTIEVPVIQTVIEKVYLDNNPSITVISLSFFLSLSLTILSFKIKLPKRLEEELQKVENLIKYFKIGSLILTIMIFIKLAMILLSLRG